MKKNMFIFLLFAINSYLFAQQSLIGSTISIKNVNYVAYDHNTNKMVYIAPSDRVPNTSYSFFDNGTGSNTDNKSTILRFFWKEHSKSEGMQDVIMVELPYISDDDVAVFNKHSYELTFEDGTKKFMYVSYYDNKPIVVYIQYSKENFSYFEAYHIEKNIRG